MAVLNDLGAGLLALEIVFTVLMTLAVIGRIWSLRILGRSLIVADYLVFVAWAAGTAFNACIIWDCFNNFGAPYTELTPQQRVVFAKVLFQAAFSWTTATVFCKLSILFFCMQIFGTIKSFRIACQVIIGLCIAYEIAFIPVFCTQCIPPQAAWTGRGTCRDIEQQEIASVSGNLVLDTAVVVLPLPFIWSLRMPVYKKIGLSVTFSIGAAIVAILCWRLVVTIRLLHGHMETGYATYLIGMQSTLEVSLGVLAACLPTLAPVSTTVLLPATRSILSSLRDKLSSLSLISSHSTRLSSTKDSGRDSSHHSFRPGRGHQASADSEAIPFSGLDTRQNVSEASYSAMHASTHDRKGMSSEGIHVFRQVDVDEESVRI